MTSCGAMPERGDVHIDSLMVNKLRQSYFEQNNDSTKRTVVGKNSTCLEVADYLLQMNGRKWTNNSMCLEGHGTDKSTFVEFADQSQHSAGRLWTNNRTCLGGYGKRTVFTCVIRFRPITAHICMKGYGTIPAHF